MNISAYDVKAFKSFFYEFPQMKPYQPMMDAFKKMVIDTFFKFREIFANHAPEVEPLFIRLTFTPDGQFPRLWCIIHDLMLDGLANFYWKYLQSQR